MERLPKCEANYAPLSPVGFLRRAAAAYADRTSVVYGGTRFTWRQTNERCLRLASSLRRHLGVARNDVVSVLAPNVPALYEMHFAVPMAGAVLNAINTRLDARGVATILAHAEARVFFVDWQYAGVAREALRRLVGAGAAMPLVVMIDDADEPTGARIGELEYEGLVAAGDPGDEPERVGDEMDAIALNYTSGTTAEPKGVVYSHRGAYLSTLSLLLQWGVGNEPVYLWSLPMFHCNGWTFTWGMAARGGTNVCIRTPSAAAIYGAIAAHGVTHMCCAPVVFGILLEGLGAGRRPLAKRVEVLTGGASPPAAVLERVEGMGFHVTHAYGMTEATGPALVCEWRAEWDRRPAGERARLKARQGVSVLTLADADVVAEDGVTRVARDGRTMGEIALRGSSVMKGYFKDEAATAASFRNGWFLTGDMGVVHPDGHFEIKDRKKDVIISGGENISSVEVEGALLLHHAVAEAAVVAMPHPRWGEAPCAFVVLAPNGDQEVGEAELVAHCRSNMAGFMVPKKVAFVEEIPRNSNGKVLKNELREMAKKLTLNNNHERKHNTAGSSSRNSRRPSKSVGQQDQDQHQHPIMAMSRL